VFPSEPERSVYNNALLARDLSATERASAVDAMKAAYDAAGVDRYAAWVHESDDGTRAELSGRGYTVVARLGGENLATAIAFDHDGDCGVFNMSTIETARRRGLGTALTARHVLDAAERGCSTASLQSTPMAERVYAAVGFRDLGRILEYGP
jgi:GNAT superfamily N-acetyltransferase